MVQKTKADLRAVRQKKLIERLRKKENWLKWGLIGALILIILLLLFLGYVTDWGMGLKKATSPLSSDSSQTTNGTTPAPNGSGGGGSGGGGSSGTSTNGQSGTNTTTTDRTTTNNSSTTNNNTTTQAPGLLEMLLSEINLGGNINDVISRANQLGIAVTCTDQLLVKECTFTVGDQTITTKSVTGLITSILDTLI